MKKYSKGWALSKSGKWHYFVNYLSLCSLSLCGKYAIMFCDNIEERNNNSPDNCNACRIELEKRLNHPPNQNHP